MRKILRLNIGIMFLGLFSTTSAYFGQEATNVNYPHIPQVLVLSVTGNHYPAITRALSTVGFQVREVTIQGYESSEHGKASLLIVPGREGEHLDPAVIKAILNDVEGGTPLLVDGSTPLTAELGVKVLGGRSEIKQYRWDRYAQRPVRLPGRLT